jgi:hypothetical protein
MANRRSVVAKTATESLKLLWENGFFRGWKDKAVIDAALSKKGNHFSDPELGMALKRAKHLTRKGKRGSYKYIQKYPYVQPEMTKTPKKKKKA